MLTLADAAASVGVDPLTLSDTASAKQDGGPFGFLAAFFEKLLKVGLLQRLWGHLCKASPDQCSPLPPPLAEHLCASSLGQTPVMVKAQRVSARSCLCIVQWSAQAVPAAAGNAFCFSACCPKPAQCAPHATAGAGLRPQCHWPPILLWVCHHHADHPGQGGHLSAIKETGVRVARRWSEGLLLRKSL